MLYFQNLPNPKVVDGSQEEDEVETDLNPIPTKDSTVYDAGGSTSDSEKEHSGEEAGSQGSVRPEGHTPGKEGTVPKGPKDPKEPVEPQGVHPETGGEAKPDKPGGDPLPGKGPQQGSTSGEPGSSAGKGNSGSSVPSLPPEPRPDWASGFSDDSSARISGQLAKLQKLELDLIAFGTPRHELEKVGGSFITSFNWNSYIWNNGCDTRRR